ncbi:uncharacterized protein LOC116417889 [Nasonia vitripennis]|uniref:CCHC-type domain-containing protein n=1 Tax=Nasonia vitripennis TaxID=7425 RepID=A0A7M7QJZ4_NASVI|nr:uncharacterized protein LOC116417889 [Nasonia vitripennis]
MLTSKEELLEALQKEIGEENIIEDSTVRFQRKTYGDMQIAVIRVPAQIAAKITKLQKIRIGWVNCMIQVANRKNEPLRCYKCLGFGHIGRNCTVIEDRSKLCFKCGKDGHKAKESSSSTGCCRKETGTDNRRFQRLGSRVGQPKDERKRTEAFALLDLVFVNQRQGHGQGPPRVKSIQYSCSSIEETSRTDEIGGQ